MSSQFKKIESGATVTQGGESFFVTHVTSANTILAKNALTGEIKALTIDALDHAERPNRVTVEEPPPPVRDLEHFTEAEWQQARSRFAIIEPMLNATRTKALIEEHAAKHNVHYTTLYKWLGTYVQTGSILSLVSAKRGPKKGVMKVSGEVEAVIGQCIQELYLQTQRVSVEDLATEIRLRCRNAGLKPPHQNTIRSRIKDIPENLRLRRRGLREQARNRFKPVLAPFPGGNYPLDLVQIDHTEADIIVVDEKNRLPICRPWLTLAIDVYSRMVVGLYVTLEKPSTTSVGLCLSMAMLPKAAYLTQLGVTGEWPVWGRMRIVHADNGKEFRGNTLKRACENYGIELNWRPVRVPHYGGHIERLMGTTASLIHTLPGTTFSNPVERKGYDSEKKAALTLAEFESLLVDLIVNVYHRRIHDELKTTPMSCWEMGIEGDGDTPGRGLPDIPVDRERLIIDFLPFEERTVQPYGVQWDDLHYLHEGMLRWINSIDPSNAKLKRKFLVRRDPRDISRIYFFDPELNDYLTAPTRGMALPPTPLWEYREARKALIESGKKSFNEHEVAEAIARIRRKAQVATDTTKGTRRAAARLKHALKAKATAPVPPEASPRVSAKPPVKPAPASVDLFSRPLQPFSIDID